MRSPARPTPSARSTKLLRTRKATERRGLSGHWGRASAETQALTGCAMPARDCGRREFVGVDRSDARRCGKQRFDLSAEGSLPADADVHRAALPNDWEIPAGLGRSPTRLATS